MSYCKLAKDQLEDMSDVVILSDLKHSFFWFVLDFSFSDRLRGCAEHIACYLLRDGRPVAGSTYGALWHLVRRLGDNGLFDTVCKPPLPGNLNNGRVYFYLQGEIF